MAFEFLGSGNSSGNVINATFSGGESVLVVVSNDAGSTGFTCSDSVNTYTLVDQRTASLSIGLLKADNVASGTVTITATGGGAGLRVAFFRYRGLAAGSAQVSLTGSVSTGGSTVVNGVAATAVTPTGAPALVFAAFGKQNNGLCQPGTGWIDRGPVFNVNRGIVEDRRVTTTNAVTATCNTNAFFEQHPFVVAVFSEAAGTFARPSSDVSTVGWKPSNGEELFNVIDEEYAQDGESDYLLSPDLAGSLTPATFTLSTTLAAGTHTIRTRVRRTATTGDVRVLLLDSSGTTVGTSSWQTLTAAFANYTFSVTTTGTTARISIEVRP